MAGIAWRGGGRGRGRRGRRGRLRPSRVDSFGGYEEDDTAELLTVFVLLGGASISGGDGGPGSRAASSWGKEMGKREHVGAGIEEQGDVVLFSCRGEHRGGGPSAAQRAAWPRRQWSAWLQGGDDGFAKNPLPTFLPSPIGPFLF